MSLYRKRYEVDSMYVFRVESDDRNTINQAMKIAHSVIDCVDNKTDMVPELTISPMKDENGKFFFTLECDADWIEVAFKIKDELETMLSKKIKFIKDKLIYSVSLGKKSRKVFTHQFDETGFEHHSDSEIQRW